MSGRAAELRRAFDASFVAAPAVVSRGVDLLLVQIADRPWAIEVRTLAALHAAATIRPIPGAPAFVRGLVALRGRALPVLDAARWLGGESTRAPRWLACVGDPPVAVALDAIESHIRVPDTALSAPSAPASAFVRALVAIEGRSRAVIDLEAMRRDAEQRASPGEGAP